ncbi:unnamed protein product [Pleuronectes platessa]|uniref:Uncharacterized protein n=1 Tax=Pleuronectes platessa TaxID=8262 RepID=A0A9N7VIB6_PLEPL|nr:unnamed protein product [Pleuronectes platessa]
MSKPAEGTPPHTHTHTHTHRHTQTHTQTLSSQLSQGSWRQSEPGVSGVIGSWSLSSGVVGSFILLLLLSIFLSALCSECSRRSFELQDSESDANPSTLISVVKLEETLTSRDNPVISEIQNDEKDFRPSEGNLVSFPPWKSHLGASQNGQDVLTNGSAAAMETSPAAESRAVEENSDQFTTWRSHLRAPEQQDSNHIYHSIGGGRTRQQHSDTEDQS